VVSDSYVEHLTGDGHPEQPARVMAIVEQLEAAGHGTQDIFYEDGSALFFDTH